MLRLSKSPYRCEDKCVCACVIVCMCDCDSVCVYGCANILNTTPNRHSPHFLLHGQESKLHGKEELPSHLQSVSHINERGLSKHIQYRIMINISSQSLIFALFGGCRGMIIKRAQFCHRRRNAWQMHHHHRSPSDI